MLIDEITPVDLWITALESGEYKQGRFKLHLNDQWCCLGVACDIYQKFGPGDLQVDLDQIDGVHYDGHNGMLPLKVSTWLGLALDNGAFHSLVKGYYSLAGLNDSATATFKDIAEVIRNRPAGLFTQGE